MTTRQLPRTETLIDALSYVKGSAARQALAEHFKQAFQRCNRSITAAEVMEHADVRLGWHQRLNLPDAIEIVAEHGLHRHAVLVEAARFDFTQRVVV
jgi:hypothetical protein